MLEQKNNILTLNGSSYIFNTSFTVFELIQYLGFNKTLIVIDYNGVILEQNLWKQTLLKNHDSLEILSIAGGG